MIQKNSGNAPDASSGIVPKNSRLFPESIRKNNDVSGVKSDNFCKGRILADVVDIWRVFLEILPLQKSKEKPRKT